MNIEAIIRQLIKEIKDISEPEKTHWNERYLHHKFSHLVQKESDYEINVTDAKNLGNYIPDGTKSVFKFYVIFSI